MTGGSDFMRTILALQISNLVYNFLNSRFSEIAFLWMFTHFDSKENLVVDILAKEAFQIRQLISGSRTSELHETCIPFIEEVHCNVLEQEFLVCLFQTINL